MRLSMGYRTKYKLYRTYMKNEKYLNSLGIDMKDQLECGPIAEKRVQAVESPAPPTSVLAVDNELKIVYERARLAKYGLTEDKHKALVRSQNNVCAVCHQSCDINDKLCIDHNHMTGIVRGLLCSRCNTGIGYFRDNAQYLMDASRYIDRTDGNGYIDENTPTYIAEQEW